MNTDHTRILTLTCSAASLGAPLDELSLAELRNDCFKRIQGAIGELLMQGIFSGTLIYQDRNPPVNLSWSLKVDDHTTPFNQDSQVAT